MVLLGFLKGFVRSGVVMFGPNVLTNENGFKAEHNDFQNNGDEISLSWMWRTG